MGDPLPAPRFPGPCPRSLWILVWLALGIGLGTASAGSLEDRCREYRSRTVGWDYNLSVLAERLPQVLPRAWPAAREELGRRIGWIRSEAARELELLEAVLATRSRLGAGSGEGRKGEAGVPGPGPATGPAPGAAASSDAAPGPGRALEEAEEALSSYLRHFSPEVRRALDAYPRPPWSRWGGTRELPAPERATAFLGISERIVSRMVVALAGLRRGVHSALKELQSVAAPLDFQAQARFDEAWFGLQAMVSSPLEPGFGPRERRDFPVEDSLDPRPRPALPARIRAPEAFPVPSGEGVRFAGDPVLVAREALRRKELGDLEAKFPVHRLGSDREALEAGWAAYLGLRSRWYGPE